MEAVPPLDDLIAQYLANHLRLRSFPQDDLVITRTRSNCSIASYSRTASPQTVTHSVPLHFVSLAPGCEPLPCSEPAMARISGQNMVCMA